MHDKLTGDQIITLASQVLPEMRNWIINRLMDYRYRDSLEVIKLVSVSFREEVKAELEDNNGD